jgi:hypothetical protein
MNIHGLLMKLCMNSTICAGTRCSISTMFRLSATASTGNSEPPSLLCSSTTCHRSPSLNSRWMKVSTTTA